LKIIRLLPVRRRFWEKVLRAIDVQGTTAQLRSQLRIVHDAVSGLAEKPLGTVLAADCVFRTTASRFTPLTILPREIDETIAICATVRRTENWRADCAA